MVDVLVCGGQVVAQFLDKALCLRVSLYPFFILCRVKRLLGLLCNKVRSLIILVRLNNPGEIVAATLNKKRNQIKSFRHFNDTPW